MKTKMYNDIDMKPKTKLLVYLHIFLMVYSTGGIFSKLAAGERFLSKPFLIFYACEIAILMGYAIGWQQFVKRLPLSLVYANKAVTVVWGGIWGVMLFKEELNVGKAIGLTLVIVGVALYGIGDAKGEVGNAG